MSNNLNQGASIEAEREEYSAFREWWQDHLHEEGSMHPEIFGFEIWKAARRTPAVAAGAGELPPPDTYEPNRREPTAYKASSVARIVTDLRAQLATHERAYSIVVEQCRELSYAQLAAKGQGEPVAWMVGHELFISHDAIPFRLLPPLGNPVPLYLAAPASAQPADTLLQSHIDHTVNFRHGAQPDQRESAAEDEPERDPFYEKAVQVVRAHNRASLSLVQRTLVLGYNRTARLFEAMEKEGVVSACDANGHRTVLAAAPSLATD